MTRAVWLASAAYAIVYFLLGWDRYATYHAGSDLGLFTQSIATVFHGFSNTTEGGSHFTFHFSPIFYACAPLLLATHSPLALVAIQAVAGALAVPPLYLIARRRLPERLALGVAGVALLYPPLAGVTFTDFHENGFVPAATLWLLWALDARRFGVAAGCVAVLLAVKEDQAVVLAAAALLGLAYFARAGDRPRALFAAGTFAACAVAFVGFFEVVRPLAGARDVWGPTHFYTWSRIVDPRGTAPWTSIGRPAYFLEALAPLGFACLLSPAFALALPGFAEVLASHESITYTMGTHYAAVWIPYVLFAFALGVANAHRRAPRLARGIVRASLGLCALVLAVASPTHWGHYLTRYDAHDRALDAALARLTPDQDVGTFDEAYAHLGFDPHARLGLDGRPRFALVDRTYAKSWFTVRWAPVLERAARDGRSRRLWSIDGIDLYDVSNRSALNDRAAGAAPWTSRPNS